MADQELPDMLRGLTLQQLLDGTPDALVIVDAKGTIVLANRQAEGVFGYPVAELLGSSVDRLVPDAVRPLHAGHRERFMHDPKNRPMGAAMELRARRKNGSEIPVEISLSPLPTEHGLLVCAAIRDVTDRRKAQEKFRALLESAPDAIVIVDAKGRIVLANAQAERLFGYARAELLALGVDALVPDAVRAHHAGHRQRFMADPKNRPMGAALDLRARRKDGTEIPVEISLSPLDTGEGPLVSAAIRDISDRRRMEEERRASADRERELARLRELDLFKTTFLNTAAHELRTPLLPVKAQFYVLKRRMEETATPQDRESITILDRNITRLATLVDDLLDAARHQAGRIEVHPVPADLHTILREATDSFQQAAKERRIQLALSAQGPGHGTFDAGRITQVIYNLLSNAVKFTPDGGRIEVHCDGQGGQFTVRVKDSGLGLSANDIAKLFRPFAQLQEAIVPGQRGSGLGLYISRGFVEAHGGRIWVESAGTGLGSTFFFTLPARPGAAVGAGAPTTAGS